MKKTAIAAAVLAALLLLAGCGEKNGPINGEEAQKIALKDAGLSAGKVTDIHTHVGEYEGAPCYSIHITVGDTEYEYVISAKGEILASEKN